jgi:SAM-dependent methyltransferase
LVKKTILNNEDLFEMLDHLLRDPREFWENFYVDRDKEIPFFKIKGPDENLVDYFQNDIKPVRVLELGCGPGRNAIFMAQKGCRVDALDISKNAIDWAKERANEAGMDINFHCQSFYEFSFEANSYDFVYDCGFLHHLAPHRRLTYLEILKKALKPNGYFGLVCFNTDGALDTSDWEIYKSGSLKRGIGYTEERLKQVFAMDFETVHFRKMKKIAPPCELFGEDFLWATLMKIKTVQDA